MLELSSFQLDYLDFIKPKVSIISNIKEDHISYHGSFKKYQKAKIKICNYQDEKDFAILNYDDPNLRKVSLKKNFTRAKIIWVSLRKRIKGGISFLDDILYDDCFTKKNTKLKKLFF